MIIPLLIILIMGNVPDKFVEKFKSHIFKFSNFFFSEIRVFYEITKCYSIRQAAYEKAHARCMLED
jgi:hypothetical protein